MELIPKYQTGRGFIQANPEQAKKYINNTSQDEYVVNKTTDNSHNYNSRRGGRTQNKIDAKNVKVKRKVEVKEKTKKSASNTAGHWGSMGSFYNNGYGPTKEEIHDGAAKVRDKIGGFFESINPSKLAYLDMGQTSPFVYSDFDQKEVQKGRQEIKEAADKAQSQLLLSTHVRRLIPEEWQEDNPMLDLALMGVDIGVGPKVMKGTTKIVKDWRPWVPYNKNRYYRHVDKIGDPIGDANRTGVIRGPGSDPQLQTSVMNAYDETGRRPFNKHYTHLIEYPMFSKGKPWHGFWAFLDRDRIIIRSKKNTGPIIWEQSGKDFNYNNYNNIYRPNWYGDVNAAPTQYFEYWEPKRFGYMRRNFQ